MTPPPDVSALSSSEKDALIARLLARIDTLVARVEALEAENAALRAENAALREKLNLPAKTPDNSSTPPSQGHKASGGAKAKPKGKAHAGTHRPLHPHPTRRRDVLAREALAAQRDHLVDDAGALLWRDNLDEVAATIRMAIWCRGWLMIDVRIARRKAYF